MPEKRTETGDDAVIRDVAHAIAASKCWIARQWGGPLAASAVADHEGECAWCEFDGPYIIEKLEEFNEWSGLTMVERVDADDPMMRPLRGTVETFAALDREEQRMLVREAQGYTTEPLVQR